MPTCCDAASVFVEYEPQTRIEGDLQQMPADFAVTELWRVLSGQAAGRTSDAQVTVFDSVGFAVEDYAVLHVLHAMARELGIGDVIQLVPRLRDPKDLFATIGRGAQAATAATPLHTVTA